MTQKPYRLIFFGNERLATGVVTKAPILLGLISAGYDIAALVLNQAPISSRNDRQPEVISIATKHNIPVIYYKSGDGTLKLLSNFRAEAGVLVAFGRLVPKELINIFPQGIINLHPSLLPKYRGPTPIEQTILDGQTVAGVSLIDLSSKMDEGQIYAQANLKISASIAKQELVDKLLDLGQKLFIKNLPNILYGSLKPVSQNNKLATYTKLINKQSGLIDTSKSSNRLESEVRAFQVWPKSRIKLYGHEIIVTKVRSTKADNALGLVIKCATGWLEIVELTAPSGRTMTGADFKRGYDK